MESLNFELIIYEEVCGLNMTLRHNVVIFIGRYFHISGFLLVSLLRAPEWTVEEGSVWVGRASLAFP